MDDAQTVMMSRLILDTVANVRDCNADSPLTTHILPPTAKVTHVQMVVKAAGDGP